MLYKINSDDDDMARISPERDLELHNEVLEIINILHKGYTGENAPIHNSHFFRKIINDLLLDYTHDQVKALVFCHYEWYGADGKSDWVHKNMYDMGFPFGWLKTNCKHYEHYIRRTLDGAWESPPLLHEYVEEWERRLFKE